MDSHTFSLQWNRNCFTFLCVNVTQISCIASQLLLSEQCNSFLFCIDCRTFLFPIFSMCQLPHIFFNFSVKLSHLISCDCPPCSFVSHALPLRCLDCHTFTPHFLSENIPSSLCECTQTNNLYRFSSSLSGHSALVTFDCHTLFCLIF